MSDQEVIALRSELQDFRNEVRKEFQELRDWKESTEVGMTGNEHHGVWGYKQKIDYNREKIAENEKENSKKHIDAKEHRDSIEMKVNKIVWTAIGAASVAGSAAAIIFSLLQATIFGG